MRAEAIKMFFDERERYDAHLTARVPKWLKDAVTAFKKEVGESANEVLVRLLKRGVVAMRWSMKHRKALDEFRRAQGIESNDVLLERILDEWLEAHEKRKR